MLVMLSGRGVLSTPEPPNSRGLNFLPPNVRGLNVRALIIRLSGIVFFLQFWHNLSSISWKALWFSSNPILFVYLQSCMFGLACSIDTVHIQQSNRILKCMSMTESCLSSLCQWALLWEGHWKKPHILIIWTELEPGYGDFVIILKKKCTHFHHDNVFVSPLLTFQQA